MIKRPAFIRTSCSKAAGYLAFVLPVLHLCMPLTLYADAGACLSATGDVAVKACETELRIHPDNLDAIVAMSDALIGLSRYGEAVHVLEDGLKRLPGNSVLERKLAVARSYVKEREFINKKGPDTKVTALARRNAIRCSVLKGAAALDACNAALRDNPAEPKFHKSRGNALLVMERYVESILAYRKALELSPGDKEAASRLKTAEGSRQELVAKCEAQQGKSSLAACEAALLSGSPDQFRVQRNKGDLLLSMNRTPEAIQAYQDALAIDPGNTALVKKIAALTTPVKVARIADDSRNEPAKARQAAKPKEEPDTVPGAPEPKIEVIRHKPEPVPEPAPEPKAVQPDRHKAEPAPKPAPKPKAVQPEKSEAVVVAKGADLPAAGERAADRVVVAKDSTTDLTAEKRYSNAPLANGVTF